MGVRIDFSRSTFFSSTSNELVDVTTLRPLLYDQLHGIYARIISEIHDIYTFVIVLFCLSLLFAVVFVFRALFKCIKFLKCKRNSTSVNSNAGTVVAMSQLSAVNPIAQAAGQYDFRNVQPPVPVPLPPSQRPKKS